MAGYLIHLEECITSSCSEPQNKARTIFKDSFIVLFEISHIERPERETAACDRHKWMSTIHEGTKIGQEYPIQSEHLEN